jgi:hypothetical protein
MSDKVSFPIFKATDEDYLQALINIAETDAAKQLGLKSLVLSPVVGPEFSYLSIDEVTEDEALRKILDARGKAISSFTLKNDGHRQVVIRREEDYHNGVPNKDHDTLDLIRESRDFPPDLNENFTTLVAEALNAVKTFSFDTFAPLLGNAAAKHLEARECALTRLETLHAKVLRELEEKRSDLHEQAMGKERTQQEKYEKRVEELEGEYQERDSKLTEREEALDERKRQLDDRSSTHVRREIRENLLGKLKDRQGEFALSKDTSKRRSSVFWVYIALLLVFGSTTAANIFMEVSGVGTDFGYWGFGTRIVSSFGFVITAGFLLRWLNRWAQQHADEEFKAKQFELDFDRACFLVEMAFEFQADEKEIPPHLLESLSANLFGAKGDKSSHDDSMTGTDALANMLLGVGGKVRVSFPGGDVELDNKGLDKLDKRKPKGS